MQASEWSLNTPSSSIRRFFDVESPAVGSYVYLFSLLLHGKLFFYWYSHTDPASLFMTSEVVALVTGSRTFWNNDTCLRLCVAIILIVVQHSKAWSSWHSDNRITCNTSLANNNKRMSLLNNSNLKHRKVKQTKAHLY